MPFYAVKVGMVPGIYETWDECKRNVDGFSGAKFKKFDSLDEAQSFIKEKNELDESYKKLVDVSEMSLEEYCKLFDKDTVNAFVDGSYNQTKPSCGAGALIIRNGKTTVLSDEVFNKDYLSMRNIYGEIVAAELVFGYAVDKGLKEINIFHDYEGLAKWCTGEWTANKERVKKYKELYDEVSKVVKINFIHVKGHVGNPGNEAADIIAKKACGIG